jgi:Sigma-70 region 2
MVSGSLQGTASNVAVLVRDERLARSVTDGDQEAFAELYERYQQPLMRYCRSILGAEADSQDAVQSAFVRALAALQRDSRNAPLRPWLYRIADNEACRCSAAAAPARSCASSSSTSRPSPPSGRRIGSRSNCSSRTFGSCPSASAARS